MKKSQDILVSKFVYRKMPFRGGYWSKHKFTDDYTSLSQDFPAASGVSMVSKRFKLNYICNNTEYTIWSDKHGNIIVRILHKDIKQTKIDF